MNHQKGRYLSVGILYSRVSQSTCAETARRLDAIYHFHGATGHVQWLKGEYGYLAPNGAASLLRRLCIKFDWLKDEDMMELKNLDRYHTLIIPHAVALPPGSHQTLESWVSGGGYLFATGQTDVPAELLGLSEIKWYRPRGYTAISYRGNDVIAGYRDYTLAIVQPSLGSEVWGSAYEVMNPQERTGMMRDFHIGPGIIRTGRVLYITAPLFETFGAMLQGHVDFEEMRGWGHRYKYLDLLGRFVKDILEEAGWRHLWSVRIKPWGESEGVVVLRHDVDESSDVTYLDYERENQIPATYAILDDHHRQHWLKAVATHPAGESAYHFDTSEEKTSISKLLLSRSGSPINYFQRRSTGKGLWKQIIKARDALGIPILTAQRHNSFFRYPETVDAMNYLYEQEPEVLGLGTMFRFTNMMFGGKKEKGGYTYVVQHPDTSVPFWFPFKLWYASTDSHHALRGWDITHVLEPEPWLTEHLLNQEDYLEEGVYTFGFHPAHCRGKRFCPDGNWEWFKYVVELGQSRGYLFMTCKEIFKRLNQWENLGFGLHAGEGWLENRTSSLVNIYLEHGSGELLLKEKKGSIESLKPTLSKLVLASGERVLFSMG